MIIMYHWWLRLCPQYLMDPLIFLYHYIVPLLLLKIG